MDRVEEHLLKEREGILKGIRKIEGLPSSLRSDWAHGQLAYFRKKLRELEKTITEYRSGKNQRAAGTAESPDRVNGSGRSGVRRTRDSKRTTGSEHYPADSGAGESVVSGA